MLGIVSCDRLAALVTGRGSWRIGLATVLLGVGFIVLIGANSSGGQAPLSLPTDSDSAKLDAVARQFPGAIRSRCCWWSVAPTARGWIPQT